MRRTALAFLAALSVAACQPGAPRDPAVSDAWVRLPAVPGNPAAGYFTLAGGDKADELVAIETPKAARVELHESRMHEGHMSMHALDGVAVPAGGTVRFAPAGNHAMLFGLDGSVQAGGTLPLTLRFASGRTIEAEARTVAAGGSAP